MPTKNAEFASNLGIDLGKPADYPEAIRERACMHGIKQKVDDEVAGWKKAGISEKDAKAKQERLLKRLKAGEWGRGKDPVLTKALDIVQAKLGDKLPDKFRSTFRSRGTLIPFLKKHKLDPAKVMANAEKLVEQDRQEAQRRADAVSKLADLI